MKKRVCKKTVKENTLKIVSAYNRLMSLMKTSQRALVKPEFKNKFGIDSDYFPVTIGYTGKIKRITWEKLCEFFKDERTKYERRTVNADVDHRYIRDSITNRLSKSELMRFVKVVSGEEIHDAFINERPGSCMGGKDELSYKLRSIYVNNPDIVDCVVFGGKNFVGWS